MTCGKGYASAGALPDYYLRNFHYQTDGYLSEHSARLYDQQVEVLFIGSADAMRRQALPPIAAFLAAIAARRCIWTSAAAPAAFWPACLDNFPQLRTLGLDLSLPYLAEAARLLRPEEVLRCCAGLRRICRSRTAVLMWLPAFICCTRFRAMCADASRTKSPVFSARAAVSSLSTSLQIRRSAGMGRLLAGFPKSFHEPYYADYAATDLGALFTGAGLRRSASDIAFLSKILVFDKPGA